MTYAEAVAKGLIQQDVVKQGSGELGRERSRTYFVDPARLGTKTVVIPSSKDGDFSGGNIAGFDPDGPQVCIIDPHLGGSDTMVTGGDGRAMAAQRRQEEAKMAAAKKRTPRRRTPKQQPPPAVEIQPAPPAEEPFELETPQETNDVTQQKARGDRPVLSTAPPKPPEPPKAVTVAPTGGNRPVKKPHIKVEYILPGMALPVLYHEVILTEGDSLVVIFDTRYQEGNPPPTFQPNDEDKPFRINVGPYQLVANYYGQTFTDELEREFTIFVVDREQSQYPEPQNAQQQDHQSPVG